MRIQIASDLHLEHLVWRFPDFRGVEPAAADVLVLAGDIANGTQALELFRDWPCPVLYVPGNHEYYGGSLAAVDLALADKTADLPNITVLNPGVVAIGGVRFIGCTLWTDYGLFGEAQRAAAMAACAAMLPDHKVIRAGEEAFTPEFARELHCRQRAWLAQELARPFAGPTVVITHHAPSPQSLHPVYARDLVSAAFISDLEDLLGAADLHIHGHTHHSFDYRVRGTRVVANPLGYCRGVKRVGAPDELQRENPAFEPRLVVDLPA